MPPPFRRMKQEVAGKIGEAPVNQSRGPSTQGHYLPSTNHDLRDPRGAQWPSQQYTQQQQQQQPVVPSANPTTGMSDAELNRMRARGALGTGLGGFLNAETDVPHSHAVSKRKTEEETAPTVDPQQHRYQQQRFQQQQAPRTYTLPQVGGTTSGLATAPQRGPPTVNSSKQEPLQRGSRPAAADPGGSGGGGRGGGGAPPPADVDVGLIELVYRNNAEAQRSYLDFSPY